MVMLSKQIEYFLVGEIRAATTFSLHAAFPAEFNPFFFKLQS
jgi:hypothetical protein